MLRRGCKLRVFFLLIGVVGMLAATASEPVSAKTKKAVLTHLPSYAVFDSNGTSAGSTASACNRTGCANGIRLRMEFRGLRGRRPFRAGCRRLYDPSQGSAEHLAAAGALL